MPDIIVLASHTFFVRYNLVVRSGRPPNLLTFQLHSLLLFVDFSVAPRGQISLIVGSSTPSLPSSLTYTLTILSVHASRFDRRMYGSCIKDASLNLYTSYAAMASGVVAGVALILLAVLDTFRFHEEHRILLLVCFVGLVCSMVGTTVVYWDQCWWPSPFRRLRA